MRVRVPSIRQQVCFECRIGFFIEISPCSPQGHRHGAVDLVLDHGKQVFELLANLVSLRGCRPKRVDLEPLNLLHSVFDARLWDRARCLGLHVVLRNEGNDLRTLFVHLLLALSRAELEVALEQNLFDGFVCFRIFAEGSSDLCCRRAVTLLDVLPQLRTDQDVIPRGLAWFVESVSLSDIFASHRPDADEQ